MRPLKVIFPHELPIWSNIQHQLIDLREKCLSGTYSAEDVVCHFQEIYECISPCYGLLSYSEASQDKENAAVVPKLKPDNEEQKVSGAKKKKHQPKSQKRVKQNYLWFGLYKFLKKTSDGERRKFIKATLPAIIDLALQLQHLVPEEGLPFSLQQCGGSTKLSRQCVASMVACAFLSLFADRERSRQGRLNVANFSNFFKHLPIASQVGKLRCILHYFDRVTEAGEQLRGNITFTRKVLHQDALPTMEDLLLSDAELCPLRVHHDGFIEDTGSRNLQVDFANKCIGGGVLGRGRVQEEIRFSTCPELIASMLFMETMQDNEAILITGFEQFSQTAGYASGLEFVGDFSDPAEVDVEGNLKNTMCAMDATPFKFQKSLQYTESAVLRELRKALVGFCDVETVLRHFPKEWDTQSSLSNDSVEDPIDEKEEQMRRHLSDFAQGLFSRSLQEALEELRHHTDLQESHQSSDGSSSLVSTSSSSDIGLEIPPLALAFSLGSSPRAGETLGCLVSSLTPDALPEFRDLPAIQIPTTSNGSSDHLLEMDYNEFLANYRRRSSNLSDVTSRRSSSSTKQSSELSSDLEEIYESFLHMEKRKHNTITEEVCSAAVSDFAAKVIASVVLEGTSEAAQMLPGMQWFGSDAPQSNIVKPQAIRPGFPRDSLNDSGSMHSDVDGHESDAEGAGREMDVTELEEYADQFLKDLLPEAMQTAVSLGATSSPPSPRCPSERAYREYAEQIVEEVFLRVAHDMAVDNALGGPMPPVAPVQIGGLPLFARDRLEEYAMSDPVPPRLPIRSESPPLPDDSRESFDSSSRSSIPGSSSSDRKSSLGCDALAQSCEGFGVGTTSDRQGVSHTLPVHQGAGSVEGSRSSPTVSLRDVPIAVPDFSKTDCLSAEVSRDVDSGVSSLTMTSLDDKKSLELSVDTAKGDSPRAVKDVDAVVSSVKRDVPASVLKSSDKVSASLKSDSFTGSLGTPPTSRGPSTTSPDSVLSPPIPPTGERMLSFSAFSSAIIPPPTTAQDSRGVTLTSDLHPDLRTSPPSLRNPHPLTSGASGNIPPGCSAQASPVYIAKNNGGSTMGDNVSTVSARKFEDGGCSVGDNAANFSQTILESGASSGAEGDATRDLYDTAALIVHRVFESLPDHLDKMCESKPGYKSGRSAKGQNLSSDSNDSLRRDSLAHSIPTEESSWVGGGPIVGLLTKKLSREILTNAFLKVEHRRPFKTYERRSSEPCHSSIQLSLQAYHRNQREMQDGERPRRMPRPEDDFENVRDCSRRGSLDSYNLSNRRMSSGFQDPTLSKFAEELMKADVSVPPLLLPRRGSSTSTATSHRSSLSGFKDPVLASLENELLNSSFSSLASPRQSGARPKYRHSQSMDSRCLQSDGSETELWFPLPRRLGSECLEELERLNLGTSLEGMEDFADIISSNILQQAASVLSWEEEGAAGDAMASSPRAGAMHPLAHSSRHQSLSRAAAWTSDEELPDDLPMFSDHLAREIIKDALEEYHQSDPGSAYQLACSRLSSDTLDTEVTNQSDFQDALDIPYHHVETLADTVASRIIRHAFTTLRRRLIYQGQFKSLGRPVATGNWGCGAFGGDVHLKAMLQWVAASLVRAPSLQYFTFCNSQLTDFDKLVRASRCYKWRVRDLMRHVCTWCTMVVQEAAVDGQRQQKGWAPKVTLFDYLLSVRK